MEPDLISRACPLCERNQSTSLYQKGPLHLVRCDHCRMVYANPVEQELVSGLFYDRRASSFYLSPEKLESDHAPVRFERELRHFRSHCQRGRVLDVGCSTGAFLIALDVRYPGQYVTFGTDVVGAALDYAESRGVRVIRTPFLELAGDDSSFDAVTFWAVIEHLVEPKRFLDKSAFLLKPGGHCFVLVPNLKSFAVRVLGAKYRYIMPDHVNYFTAATLRAFGRHCRDFEFVDLLSTHFNPLVIIKDFFSIATRVPDSERAHLLKRTTAWKQNHWLRPLKLLYSASERLLASLVLADNLVIVLRKKA